MPGSHHDLDPEEGIDEMPDATDASSSPRMLSSTDVELTFPDVPRLELDQLLEQLRDRADDVLAAQGRLRGLLRANAAVASDLSLPVVLRRIVEAARELLPARYAALGVIGDDGELEQFVHSGMEDDVVTRIGALPRGHGILGLLRRYSAPIRLADLSEHPDSAGFPLEHPPMSSFLGVPIRIGDEVFGNLYLTERTGGTQFTQEDEELAMALAATAGAAISNARLFAESEHRRRWLAAARELTQRLLTGDVPDPFRLITSEALAAADADFATVVLPEGDELVVKAASGELADEMVGLRTPWEATLAGRAISTGKPLLIADRRGEDSVLAFSQVIGPVAVVPLTAGEGAKGALTLGRLAGRPRFIEGDLAMAATFGNHAAVALELVEARSDQVELARIEDHDRIARDLHDHVIQEVFAVGIGLQGLLGLIDKPAVQARVSGYIDGLDRVVTQIRSTIFQLETGNETGSLHAQLLDIAQEHTAQLGFVPHVRFLGTPDAQLTPGLVGDVLAVAREGLSNAARHAGASSVEISLGFPPDEVLVEIADNGCGIGEIGRSSGLTNMRRRAENHNGALTISTPEGGGTRLRWTAFRDDCSAGGRH